MVIFLKLLFFFLFTEGWILGQALPDVKVNAEIEKIKFYENQTLKGLISIIHEQKLKVDPSSFTLDGKPLSVEFINEVEISPPNPLVVSYYRFTIPGQLAGPYLLPEISVKVGDKTFVSIPSTYQVEALQKETKENASSTPFLKLQMVVDLNQKLYPGQRFRVTYRYLFNQNIELSEEKLPLLDPVGFNKVGKKDVKSYQEDKVTIQEISQTLEASKVGEYKIPESRVVGYVYQNDFFGHPVYQKPPLEATEKEITITVSDFPTEGKPASFNGAIGPFDQFNVTLTSPSSIFVGDKIEVSMEIRGEGQIDNVPIPELCCQPGFSGLFQLSDLPPTRELKNQTLHTTVELRPLSSSIQAIPSIEFSFFNPQTGKYGVLQSASIPIKVKEVIKEEAPEPQKKEPISKPDWSQTPIKQHKMEIKGNFPMTVRDLNNLIFGTWSVLYLIPIGFLGAFFQIALHRYFLMKKTQVKPKRSYDYFNEAMQAHPSSPQFHDRLNKAFKLLLQEKQLSKGSLVEEVEQLMKHLEEKRFTGQEKSLGETQVNEARSLFKKIDREVNP